MSRRQHSMHELVSGIGHVTPVRFRDRGQSVALTVLSFPIAGILFAFSSTAVLVKPV